MANRRPGLEPGILAQYPRQCAKCDGPIVAHKDRILYRRGQTFHIACWMEAHE